MSDDGESGHSAAADIVVEAIDAHAALAAQLVAQALCRCLERADRASLFLAGGSTPRDTYRCLASTDLAWERVDFYWGDERCVAPDDERSNFALARRELLEPLGASPESIHRIRGELGARSAASRYEALLRERFELPARPPDVVLLGLGADGHTASLFGAAATDRSSAWVLPAVSPAPPGERVTLTVRFLAAAREIFFVVTGPDKADALAAVLDPEGGGPAAEVGRRAPRVVWILDEAAAAEAMVG